MEIFLGYLMKIENPERRALTEAVLKWVSNEFPFLKPRIAWNQPMFTDHGHIYYRVQRFKKPFGVHAGRAGHSDICRSNQRIRLRAYPNAG